MEIRYPAAPEERPRVLLVESNRTHLGVVARRLSENGYRVITADCAAAAIAELYRRPVDLVLAEFNMPRTSGTELVRAIRGEVQWNDIPIMLITGKSRPSDAVQAYSAGADDVIAKPFHFEVLFASIDRRICAARSVRRLRTDNATLDARLVERAIQIGELRDRLQEERCRGPFTL
jgi:DNA-binding response OmpR family regulator